MRITKKIVKGSTRVARARRHFRVRKRLSGTTERPRLVVTRSARHLVAQIVDDTKGHTLASASTMEKDLRQAIKNGGNAEAAKQIGKLVAERAVKAGVVDVAFDRSGHRYHGRIKALAEAAREAGLKF